MIDYYDSELIQILPDTIKKDPELKAISFSIANTVKKLIRYADSISTYAVIDVLPERILDLMAIENRVSYYDETMEVEKKREIIRNAMRWYEKAGTPKAVEELIQIVFGEGKVLEWFDYGGKPYRFKIQTNASMTPEVEKKIRKMIKSVKNTRSHLESIEIIRKIELDIYVGSSFSSYKKSIIT